MAERFSLKDHLFNRDTVCELGAAFAGAVPGFAPAAFVENVLAGFPERELLARIAWMATCLEPYLAPDFPTMADQIEAALPPPLDPRLRDDDFGHFIWAVPGELVVRHGLKGYVPRSLDLLHAATQRFSMEYYIRPFLNAHEADTLERLKTWARDENYHVRRLVSEGTRPKLPWAKAVRIGPEQTLPLLDLLHGDRTRFVTRSVANHLNDIARTQPDTVMDVLTRWAQGGTQDAAELAWMTSHALRSLIKQGHPRAMTLLGYDPQARIDAVLSVAPEVRIGDVLSFQAKLAGAADAPVLVDFALHTTKADGTLRAKVFKLKQARMSAAGALTLEKRHRLKGDATTFRLFPGPARLELLVNGRVRAAADLTLVS